MIELAQSRGIIVHVSFFDGACSMQPRASWRDSWWNIDNQKVNYYGNLDLDRNNNVDADGEFYRLSDFNDDTGVGYYQRRLIAKIIEEFDQYNNVMYEVGNETYGAPANCQECGHYVRSNPDKSSGDDQPGLPDRQSLPSSTGTRITMAQTGTLRHR